MAATANWTAVADFPVNGSPRDKLGFALKSTSLAVGRRGWQSWQFTLSDQFVELSATRTAPGGPPDHEGRDAMIHCGAALQHLKLALKRHGCLGRVELFPDLDQPALAARVHCGHGGPKDNLDLQLFDALPFGESEFTHAESPPFDLALLTLNRAMTGERGWLEFAHSESNRHRLAELINSTARGPVKKILFQTETLVRAPDGDWVAGGITGTTLQERFSRWRRPSLAVKFQPATTSQPPPPPATNLATPNGTFAVLKTKTDDKHGWLAAGQSLARLLLHTRVLKLACIPHLDVLQRPALRAELRTAIGHKGFTQAILQFETIPALPMARTQVASPVTETGVSA